MLESASDEQIRIFQRGLDVSQEARHGGTIRDAMVGAGGHFLADIKATLENPYLLI